MFGLIIVMYMKVFSILILYYVNCVIGLKCWWSMLCILGFLFYFVIIDDIFVMFIYVICINIY